MSQVTMLNHKEPQWRNSSKQPKNNRLFILPSNCNTSRTTLPLLKYIPAKMNSKRETSSFILGVENDRLCRCSLQNSTKRKKSPRAPPRIHHFSSFSSINFRSGKGCLWLIAMAIACALHRCCCYTHSPTHAHKGFWRQRVHVAD